MLKQFIFAFLLILVNSEKIQITPPFEGSEKQESQKIAYQIKINPSDFNTFLLIKIKPKVKDNFKGVYVGKNGDPSMGSSQYKCIESPCYLWIPKDYYSKVNLLDMNVECKDNCDYDYRIEYVKEMFIEDNSSFAIETNPKEVSITYPLAKKQEDSFILLVTGAGKTDMTPQLKYSKPIIY